MATDSQKKLDVLLVVFLLVALGGLAMLIYKSRSSVKATPPPAAAVPVVPPAIATKVPPPPPPPAEAIEAPRPPTIALPKVIPPPPIAPSRTAGIPVRTEHFHRAAPSAGIGAGTMPSLAGAAVAPVPPPVTAPVPPPPPPPVEDDATKLDEALAKLKPGNLAYTTPPNMKMEDTAHIVAKIGTDAVSTAALTAGMATDAGTQVVTVATSITPKMKMTLTSGDFTITALSSEEQMVAGSEPTTWAWDIQPKHSGTLRLHLAATIELNGLAKDFTTVDREIAVQVDPADVVEDFMQANWQWLIATLTGIFGAAWRYFAGRKKAATVAA